MKKLIVALTILIIVTNFSGLAQSEEQNPKLGISCSFKNYVAAPDLLFPTFGGVVNFPVGDSSLKSNLEFGPLKIDGKDVPGMLILSNITFYPSFLRLNFMNEKMHLVPGGGLSLNHLQAKKNIVELKKLSKIIQEPKLTTSLTLKTLNALSIELRADIHSSNITALSLQLAVWF